MDKMLGKRGGLSSSGPAFGIVDKPGRVGAGLRDKGVR